jgi:NAD(P)-dependent dehydrogenase (short-subunit alcohol dehydrogenase family)
MSKAAVRSMGRPFAMDPEMLNKKIRVNTLSPGAILTPMVSQNTPEMQKAIGEYIQATVPMGRWGLPDEAGKAVLFLASDDSSYMTGGELLIDGGLAQI